MERAVSDGEAHVALVLRVVGTEVERAVSDGEAHVAPVLRVVGTEVERAVSDGEAHVAPVFKWYWGAVSDGKWNERLCVK